MPRNRIDLAPYVQEFVHLRPATLRNMTADRESTVACHTLWLCRKCLHDWALAPGLRRVYEEADVAHAALTLSGDRHCALEHVRTASRALLSVVIGRPALERRLATHEGGDSVETLLAQLRRHLRVAEIAMETEEDYDPERAMWRLTRELCAPHQSDPEADRPGVPGGALLGRTVRWTPGRPAPRRRRGIPTTCSTSASVVLGSGYERRCRVPTN